MNDSEKAAFRLRLQNSVTVAETMAFLRELQVVSGDDKAFSREEQLEETLSALTTLRRQCVSEAVLPRNAIVEYGLPLAVLTLGSEQARFALQSLRELLGEWINELPTDWATSLFEECLSVLVPRLGEAGEETISPICWAIGDIGYRTPRLIAALEDIISRQPNKAGDVALGTLVGLGDIHRSHNWYLGLTYGRASARFNNSLIYSLSVLGDRSTRDFLLAEWLPSVSAPVDKAKLDAIVSILGRIAKAISDPTLHEVIAETFESLQVRFGSELGNTFMIRGDILPNCDSPSVIRLLLAQLGTAHIDPGQLDGITRLVMVRILGCWRPRQLDGCDAVPSERAFSILKTVLFTTEDYSGRSLTPLNHLKDYIVSGLLRLGRSELPDWYPEILAAQRNPYARHELLEAMAVFRFDDFPREVKNMISEVRDLKGGDGDAELLVRLSASRLVRSSGTLQAFNILLEPGLTYNGAVMRDTVEALADVSVELCEDPQMKEQVIGSLLGRLGRMESDPIESSICRALNALALAQKLDPRCIELLANEIAKPVVEARIFIKSLLVQAIATFPEEAIPRGTIELMKEWSRSREDWLGWRSIEALIRLRLFASLQGMLTEKLGLVRNDAGWQWNESRALCSWASSFLVLLYDFEPDEFAGPVATAVLASNWERSDRTAMALLALYKRKKAPVRPQVATALIEKAKTRNRPNSADTAVISYLPHLCPSEFAAEAWNMSWENWTDDARAALANAFGELPHDFRNAQTLRMLSSLSQDTHFGVRRSALRSLAKADQSALTLLCDQALTSSLIEARRWTAECLPWIEDPGKSETYAQMLSNDPVSSIRERAESCLEERAKLSLRRPYLSRLLGADLRTNESLLAVYRYGQALAEIGDDETLANLNRFLEENNLPSRVRYLINRFSTALEKAWRTRKQKWPQPLSSAVGTLQSGSAAVLIGTDEVLLDYNLWRQIQPGIGGESRWGGNALTRSHPQGNVLGSEAFLIFSDGHRSKIGIFESYSSGDMSKMRIEFHGSGAYPGDHIPAS